MDSQQFCLRWDSFASTVTSVFDTLRQDGELVDVTLCCEGQQLRAHRMMLSACSPYFRDLLKNNQSHQMAIFLKDTSAADLNAIIEFIYKGSVNVAQSQLGSFIKTAETLQIRGLSGDDDKQPPDDIRPARRESSPPPQSTKRRRVSGPDPSQRLSPLVRHASAHLSPNNARQLPTREEPTRQESGTPESVDAAPAPQLSPLTEQRHHAGSHLSSSTDQQLVQQQSQSDPSHMTPVKVEKQEVDLASEEDTSLDATLGYVADYEGAGYNEQQMSGMKTQPADYPVQMGSPLVGPSQRTSAAQVGEDGATPASTITQRRYLECPRTFALSQDYGRHPCDRGKWCHICYATVSNEFALRIHLMCCHGLPTEEALLRTSGVSLTREGNDRLQSDDGVTAPEKRPETWKPQVHIDIQPAPADAAPQSSGGMLQLLPVGYRYSRSKIEPQIRTKSGIYLVPASAFSQPASVGNSDEGDQRAASRDRRDKSAATRDRGDKRVTSRNRGGKAVTSRDRGDKRVTSRNRGDKAVVDGSWYETEVKFG